MTILYNINLKILRFAYVPLTYLKPNVSETGSYLLSGEAYSVGSNTEI
jgi:hypothetical protein